MYHLNVILSDSALSYLMNVHNNIYDLLSAGESKDPHLFRIDT